MNTVQCLPLAPERSQPSVHRERVFCMGRKAVKRAQEACAGTVGYADLLQQRSVLILRVAQLRFQAGLLRLRGLQLLLSFLLSFDRF